MSQKIQILDKHFEPLISSDVILERVSQLAEVLNQNYHNKNPVFLPILNGSFIFAADLLKHFLSPCEVSFVKMSSYQGSKGNDNVTTLLGLDKDLKDRSIIIVDGIIETGNTIVTLMDTLNKMNP